MHDRGEPAHPADLHLADGQVQRDGGAVATPAGDLAPAAGDAGLPGSQVAREILVVVLVARWRDQHAERPPDHVVGPIAQHRLGPGAEGVDRPVHLDHDDPVHGGVDDGLELLGPRRGQRGSVALVSFRPAHPSGQPGNAGARRAECRERVKARR